MSLALPTLPDRPLRFTLPGASLRHSILVIIGAIAMLALFAATVVFVAPAVLSDWQIRNTAQPVASSRVDGSCQSKLFINFCSVELSAGKLDTAAERKVFYVFPDTHRGDYSVEVMADPARPQLLTTDLALENLNGRIGTLVVLWALLLVALVAVVRNAMRGRSARSGIAAWNGQRLRTVALQAHKLVGPNAGASFWTLQPQDGSDIRRTWKMPATARPLFLADGVVLGVTGPQGGVAAPVDEDLSWLDLTEQERAALAQQLQLQPRLPPV